MIRAKFVVLPIYTSLLPFRESWSDCTPPYYVLCIYIYNSPYMIFVSSFILLYGIYQTSVAWRISSVFYKMFFDIILSRNAFRFNIISLDISYFLLHLYLEMECVKIE